jgi:hypothetical protein
MFSKDKDMAEELQKERELREKAEKELQELRVQRIGERYEMLERLYPYMCLELDELKRLARQAG